jgi:hypothetical protein
MDKKEDNNLDIEIIMGDDSNLNFSDVEDCLNTLRPKDKENLKKKVIIPKTKNDKK